MKKHFMDVWFSTYAVSVMFEPYSHHRCKFFVALARKTKACEEAAGLHIVTNALHFVHAKSRLGVVKHRKVLSHRTAAIVTCRLQCQAPGGHPEAYAAYLAM